MNVCVISEGAYPTGRGGVSEWCHSLIGRMEDVRFNVFSISTEKGIRYSLPEKTSTKSWWSIYTHRILSMESMKATRRTC